MLRIYRADFDSRRCAKKNQFPPFVMNCFIVLKRRAANRLHCFNEFNLTYTFTFTIQSLAHAIVKINGSYLEKKTCI